MPNSVKVSLNGLIASDNPTDPAECFNRPQDYYVDEEMILVKIDEQWWPLQLCGDTNTGMSYRGCHHGPTNATTGTDATCRVEYTGETVIAQACVLGCSYVIDPLFGAEVLLAQIDGQWFIVNVVSDPHDIQPAGQEYDRCENACCGSIGKNLAASISGCGVFDGQAVTMYSIPGTSRWDGSITIDGQTLRIQIFCNSANNTITALIGCDGTQISPQSVDLSCDPPTSTGNYIPGINGLIEHTGSIGCADCSSIGIMVSATNDDSVGELCYNSVRTGEIVKAKACGLDNLEEGDYVIIVEFPNGSGGEGGGPEALCPDPDEHRQYHIILACSTAANCPPCPPPPPPDVGECCNLAPEEIPTTLSGVFRIGSNDSGCSCPEDTPITFTIMEGSDPPEWVQDDDLTLCDAGTNTGTGVGAGAFIGLSNMRVTCSGGGTGSATSTGTGPASLFFLTPPGCEDVHVDPIASANASCDPVYMEFTADISKCCSGSTVPGVRVTLYMELAGV